MGLLLLRSHAWLRRVERSMSVCLCRRKRLCSLKVTQIHCTLPAGTRNRPLSAAAAATAATTAATAAASTDASNTQPASGHPLQHRLPPLPPDFIHYHIETKHIINP